MWRRTHIFQQRLLINRYILLPEPSTGIDKNNRPAENFDSIFSNYPQPNEISEFSRYSGETEYHMNSDIYVARKLNIFCRFSSKTTMILYFEYHITILRSIPIYATVEWAGRLLPTDSTVSMTEYWQITNQTRWQFLPFSEGAWCVIFFIWRKTRFSYAQ